MFGGVFFGFQVQNMILPIIAHMPTCNLSKNIHSTWLHMFGGKGVDLFDATSNNFARAIIHIVLYHQFLESGEKDEGPSCSSMQFVVKDPMYPLPKG